MSCVTKFSAGEGHDFYKARWVFLRVGDVVADPFYEVDELLFTVWEE